MILDCRTFEEYTLIVALSRYVSNGIVWFDVLQLNSRIKTRKDAVSTGDSNVLVSG
jgi:hypothetical protein